MEPSRAALPDGPASGKRPFPEAGWLKRGKRPAAVYFQMKGKTNHGQTKTVKQPNRMYRPLVGDSVLYVAGI